MKIRESCTLAAKSPKRVKKIACILYRIWSHIWKVDKFQCKSRRVLNPQSFAFSPALLESKVNRAAVEWPRYIESLARRRPTFHKLRNCRMQAHARTLLVNPLRISSVIASGQRYRCLRERSAAHHRDVTPCTQHYALPPTPHQDVRLRSAIYSSPATANTHVFWAFPAAVTAAPQQRTPPSRTVRHHRPRMCSSAHGGTH